MFSGSWKVEYVGGERKAKTAQALFLIETSLYIHDVFTRQTSRQVTTKGHKFPPTNQLGGSAVGRKDVRVDGQTVLSSV